MSHRRLDELAAAWSAEDPDPAQRAELEALLRQDPAARRRFLDHCVAEMALVEALAQAPASTTRPLALRPNRRARKPQPSFTGWWTAGLAAAALLVVGLLILQSPAGPSIQVVSGEVFVAGRQYPAGSQIALPLAAAQAGADGVTLGDKVSIEVYATSDTRFSIAAPGAIAVDAGELTLEVDRSRAPPTSVRTSELVAEVVGTRFSVHRRDGFSQVAVARGRVRVSTLAGAARELAAGERIGVGHDGFVDVAVPSAQDVHQPQSVLALVVLDPKGMELGRFTPDQTVRVVAGQPFALRVEAGAAIAAMRFHLADTLVQGVRPPMGLENTPPFYLWGDNDRNALAQALAAGTHQLEITCFADERGKTAVATYAITLVAAAGP